MIIISDFPPTAQQRPRVTRSHTYDPSKKDKVDFLKSVMTQLPKAPLTSSILIRIDFYFKRPKSHFTSKGELSRFAPREYTKKPDIDNLIKFVLDALNGHLYVDDAQVISLAARKLYAENDGIEIRVTEYGDLNFFEKQFLNDCKRDLGI